MYRPSMNVATPKDTPGMQPISTHTLSATASTSTPRASSTYSDCTLSRADSNQKHLPGAAVPGPGATPLLPNEGTTSGKVQNSAARPHPQPRAS